MTLNPGHAESDDKASLKRWDQFIFNMMAGGGSAEKYFSSAIPGALEWLTRNYGDFAKRPAFFNRICNLRLVAYPSPESNALRDIDPKSLPSGKAMLDLVHDRLLPRAKAGQLALLVMRAPHAWGFGRPTEDMRDNGLFVSRPLRTASISPNSRVGDLVKRFLE